MGKFQLNLSLGLSRDVRSGNYDFHVLPEPCHPSCDWRTNAPCDAYAVMEEAKAAGVCVFAGGIDEGLPPMLVSAGGKITQSGYPLAPSLDAAGSQIAPVEKVGRMARSDVSITVHAHRKDPQKGEVEI